MSCSSGSTCDFIETPLSRDFAAILTLLGRDLAATEARSAEREAAGAGFHG